MDDNIRILAALALFRLARRVPSERDRLALILDAIRLVRATTPPYAMTGANTTA